MSEPLTPCKEKTNVNGAAKRKTYAHGKGPLWAKPKIRRKKPKSKRRSQSSGRGNRSKLYKGLIQYLNGKPVPMDIGDTMVPDGFYIAKYLGTIYHTRNLTPSLGIASISSWDQKTLPPADGSFLIHIHLGEVRNVKLLDKRQLTLEEIQLEKAVIHAENNVHILNFSNSPMLSHAMQ